jgi:hypothetical protein
MENIRFAYFTARTNKGFGYICMAMKRPVKDSLNNIYEVAFSCYSPIEKKCFTKEIARKIAVGRLNNKKSDEHKMILNWTTNSNDPNFHIVDVAGYAFDHAVDENFLPGWALKAAKRGQISSGLSNEQKVG